MYLNKLNNSRYIAISVATAVSMLLGIASHAQTSEQDIQTKFLEAEEQLKSEKSQESLSHYKKMTVSQASVSKDKLDRILLYSKVNKILRGMLKSDYNPNYVAPTSMPLPDPNLSSGSDPSQIADPLKRQEAIEARNALTKRVAEHYFQRDLRKEIEVITRKAKSEAGVVDCEDKKLVAEKLIKAGLSNADAEALIEVIPPVKMSEGK